MSEVKCPYCNSAFKDKDELSKHIDRVHTGSGLLEGDRGKW
ncbi:MAG: C2H2-type zinc finger protein [Nitrososphaerales archaeon]